MQLIEKMKAKQVLVLGLGVTGMSCVRFLQSQGLIFTANDSRENLFDSTQFNDNFPQVKLSLGHWDQQLISTADIIIASPGIDLKQAAISEHIKVHCQVLGDVELFCQLLKSQHKALPILAVTGSNGKSTVVSLLVHMAKNIGLNVPLAGNIGVPVLDYLNDVFADKIDCLVLELSSFQLETLASMQALGVSILNVSDDHLDRHKTLANYHQIKQKIYQQAQTLVFNRDDALTKPTQANEDQPMISFGSDKPNNEQFGIAKVATKYQLMFGEKALLTLESLPIAGIHNALNCLAALALGQSARWPLVEMVNSLASFKGLDHRCQVITTTDNITWINDSKATNVGATLAAITSLAKTKTKAQQLILIAGGEGKGADFSPLQTVFATAVDHLITLGKDGNKLAALATRVTKVDNLIQAVAVAKQQARSGDIVILSPACASLDMFKNFAERGEQFVKAVQMLASHEELVHD